MIFSPRSLGGARALGLVVLAVTFVAGAIAATAIGQVLHADPASRTEAVTADGCDEKRGHLLDRLDLTEDQRTRIDRILERRRGQIDRFWSEAGPTLNAITDSTRAEIRAVLTPEQRELHDRLRRERKAARTSGSRDRDDGSSR